MVLTVSRLERRPCLWAAVVCDGVLDALYHYKSPFDAVLLHLTFLVWFTLLFFGCVSKEFVFSKWDLKGQRESNTGTMSLSLLGEIIVCVVVSKLWIPILCCRFPQIVLQHCGLWSLRRTISEMKLPQDAGGLLFHLVLGSHSNTSSPSTSATWRMRVASPLPS